VLVYFYFDFKDSERDSQSFLRSILLQLAVQQPGISNSLERFFNRNRHHTHISSSELLSIISSTIRDLQHVYMVVDGLDECGDREDIMHVIEKVNGCGLSNVHVLLASRPESNIESAISSFLTHQISLDEKNVDLDISIFIQAVLQDDQKLARWPLYIRQAIQKTLEDGSCGMYETSQKQRLLWTK
jgi:hypothetical protein